MTIHRLLPLSALFALVCGLAAVLLTLPEPVRWEVTARLEGNPLAPIEHPRLTELRLRGLAHTESGTVALEVETAFLRRGGVPTRSSTFDLRFLAEDPDGLQAFAQKVLDPVVALHAPLFAHWTEAMEVQKALLDAFIAKHGAKYSAEELAPLERAIAQTVALRSGRTRITRPPSEPRRLPRRWPIALFGGTAFGALLGLGLSALFRFGGGWSDPVGRSLARGLRRWPIGLAALAAGTIAGGAIGALQPRPAELRGIVRPASLGMKGLVDPNKLVVELERIGERVAPEGTVVRAWSLRDLSPHQQHIHVLEVSIVDPPSREEGGLLLERIRLELSYLIDPQLETQSGAELARLKAAEVRIPGATEPAEALASIKQRTGAAFRVGEAVTVKTEIIGPPRFLPEDRTTPSALFASLGLSIALLGLLLFGALREALPGSQRPASTGRRESGAP